MHKGIWNQCADISCHKLRWHWQNKQKSIAECSVIRQFLGISLLCEGVLSNDRKISNGSSKTQGLWVYDL